MSGWTTPQDLHAQVEKHWRRGELLRAQLDSIRLDSEQIDSTSIDTTPIDSTAFYPLTLRLKGPTARELTDDFSAVADWVRSLREGSKESRGHGYTLHWQRRQHRVHGANELPDGASIDSQSDALSLIGKERQAKQFSALAREILSRFPLLLKAWIEKRPLQLLEYRQDWPRILAVLEAFESHPRPECYLRELDIPGVHSKFIETHRGLLSELLDAVLPEHAIDATGRGARGFNQRYGLRDKPARVRFRFLDPSLAMSGIRDMEIPVADFARLRPRVDRVFVTENEINGLSFPDYPGALVIFGLGYGVRTLVDIPWLHTSSLWYWGDIDTHGFAILHRLRNHLPAARSLLMDHATLEAHRSLWGTEDVHKRILTDLSNLTSAEQGLYRTLCENSLGNNLRLEQEHVRQAWLAENLEKLNDL